MIIIETMFWVLLALTVYVYVGYPLLLLALCKIFGSRPVKGGELQPAVTLLVSAYNEGEIIESKLKNSLALNYPREQLEIIVVSDASEDGTDEIVRQFEDVGVRLLRLPTRSGKTLGINAAVEQATGEVIVFSDANAMYHRDAIQALVRNFNDPDVGAVVGESTYTESENDADKSESTYWKYETAIKRLESQLGSVVGGDGAMYAVRKGSYRPMLASALSDFVNPLQVVESGERCVYESEAVCSEAAGGTFGNEFSRKIRIVNRAWRAMMSMKQMLNPFRFGFFSFQLISHKLLRWLVPVFLTSALVLNLLLLNESPVYQLTITVQLGLYALAIAGWAFQGGRTLPAPLYIPFYFCLVNLASARGIIEAYRGTTYTTWSTARTVASDTDVSNEIKSP